MELNQKAGFLDNPKSTRVDQLQKNWTLVIPPLLRNHYNEYINPYYWVDFSHPLLYGNVMGVDRPDRTWESRHENQPASGPLRSL